MHMHGAGTRAHIDHITHFASDITIIAFVHFKYTHTHSDSKCAVILYYDYCKSTQHPSSQQQSLWSSFGTAYTIQLLHIM